MTKLIGYDQLRDYQKECVNTLNNIQGGKHLVQMATGLGKTVCFANINRPGRTLVLAHREELINQPVKYFDVPVGFEQAGRRSNGEPVVCASVQSLVRRLDKFKPDEFDMIITDEAHHAVAPSYKKIYEYFKPRVHFGFTATPNRGDKQGLGQIYDDIVFEKDIRWGIANNYLTDIKCFRIDIGFDITKVKRNKDDYNLHDLAAAVDITEQNEAVAEAYAKYHVGQTLIFATTVQHAHNIADLIPGAVVVSAETPNREEIIEAFTRREIPCIVNCMVFTEGTDMPLVETIIIARPTKNSALYTQMIGRGLRLYPGKEYLTLLDCVGASGKNDICTAPDLFGIKITKKQYESITKQDEGIMLTEIEPEMNKHYAWKINATEINLFEKEKNVSTCGVNYTKLPSGGFLLSLSGFLDQITGADGRPHLVRQAKEGTTKKTVYVGIKILVSAPDLLDKSRIIKEVRVDNAFKRDVSEPMEIGIAFGEVWRTLNKTEIYQPFRSLWDKRGNLWEYDLATEKQIALIKKRMNPALIAGVDYDTLTKGEAGRILDILAGGTHA
jgi:hypothetical protein